MGSSTRNKSKIAGLFLISTLLLIITPLLSYSTLCLYFVVNLVIVYLGAEAGLLSFPEQSLPPPLENPPIATAAASDPDQEKRIIHEEANKKVEEKCRPLTPSLFFIVTSNKLQRMSS
ncbi:hypothetical protein DM860_000462 [Cuscuta australis]|uniref:DUF4408 domain-containing protein n=1 Tax=Cuscuta australis TaxID=267555 RepID=A0A328CZ98_9ASTE|nr:hypothetical protein DM860_000462 [Cuscuta australis]